MSGQRRRSPLGIANGAGSAKHGVEHWWLERVTALALVPLAVWLIASLIAHENGTYGSAIAWLKTPTVSILMILLLIALFYHTALGLQVVIEDYIHSKLKILVVAATHLGCFALAVAGIWATLRIGLRG